MSSPFLLKAVFPNDPVPCKSWEADDTLLVTGPSGFSCDHPGQATLAAGAAAQSHAVTCSAW